MAEREGFNYPEQVSPLLEMAIVMHETYSAFRQAGFSESQAMQLIGCMATSIDIEEGNPDD
jgi:hypothetical protein